MKSIKNLFKIGYGPSSSHTMGPSFAALNCYKTFSNADFIKVILYGSLAKTGKGHGTDRAIKETLKSIKTEILFDAESECFKHPNTIDFIAYKNDIELGKKRYYSIGGGEIREEGNESLVPPEIYKENNFSEIAKYCKSKNIRLSEYVFEHEKDDIKPFLLTVWKTMQNAINEGLSKTGTLPGGLSVERKAQFLYNQKHIDESPQTRENRLVCSYAFAVSEQNADCGIIVTAPTCGSCGVVPAVLKYMQDKNKILQEAIGRVIKKLRKQKNFKFTIFCYENDTI